MTTTGSPLQVIEAFWTLIERGELDRLADYVHPDADAIVPGGLRVTGPDELRPVLQAYLTAFPTLRHHTITAIESGDQAAVELHVEVTHSGPFVTPHGELSPTGNHFVIESCDVIRVTDGRIASWHAYGDTAALMANLAPTAARA